MWVHICLVCFADILGTFPDLTSTRTVVGTHQGTQLAWMPHSTQFCHQKNFFMEWTAN